MKKIAEFKHTAKKSSRVFGGKKRVIYFLRLSFWEWDLEFSLGGFIAFHCHQCDQIGRFLTFFGDMVSLSKVAQMAGECLG